MYTQHGSPSKLETSHDHISRVFQHEYYVLLTNRFNLVSDSAVTIVIIGAFTRHTFARLKRRGVMWIPGRVP